MTLSRRSLVFGCTSALAAAGTALAQRRRRVVVRPTRVVIRPGHPIRRAVNRNVIVRVPARAVVVSAPLVFLPVIAFTTVAVAVTLPPKDRLLWQDSETIDKDEDWVESNFGIDERGTALYMDITGRAELDFADITFENGDVQVVDFNEKTYSTGLLRILDFPGRRNVKTVRLVARAKSNNAVFRMYLAS